MAQVLPRPRLVRQTNEHWLLPAPALEQWWSAGTVEERDAIIAANKSDEPLHGLDAQEFEPQRTTAQEREFEPDSEPYWLLRTAQAQDFEPCCLQDALAEPIVDEDVIAVLEEDLGEIPLVRMISCCDKDGNYVARTQEEMDAALAERDAREAEQRAAQPIAEHPFDDLNIRSPTSNMNPSRNIRSPTSKMNPSRNIRSTTSVYSTNHRHLWCDVTQIWVQLSRYQNQSIFWRWLHTKPNKLLHTKPNKLLTKQQNGRYT